MGNRLGPDEFLVWLDQAIQEGKQIKVVKMFADCLDVALRATNGKGKLMFPTPDWDHHPVGRDWFLQHNTVKARMK